MLFDMKSEACHSFKLFIALRTVEHSLIDVNIQLDLLSYVGLLQDVGPLVWAGRKQPQLLQHLGPDQPLPAVSLPLAQLRQGA